MDRKNRESICNYNWLRVRASDVYSQEVHLIVSLSRRTLPLPSLPFPRAISPLSLPSRSEIRLGGDYPSQKSAAESRGRPIETFRFHNFEITQPFNEVYNHKSLQQCQTTLIAEPRMAVHEGERPSPVAADEAAAADAQSHHGSLPYSRTN